MAAYSGSSIHALLTSNCRVLRNRIINTGNKYDRQKIIVTGWQRGGTSIGTAHGPLDITGWYHSFSEPGQNLRGRQGETGSVGNLESSRSKATNAGGLKGEGNPTSVQEERSDQRGSKPGKRWGGAAEASLAAGELEDPTGEPNMREAGAC